jgi:hypothetical protein
VITAKCAPYRHQGKPWHRPRLLNLDDYDIVRIYAAEYRGIVNYYLLARDVWRLATLRWNAETSMLKTLAAKHKSTVATIAARHKAKVITGDGPRTCFEARLQRNGKKDLIARFGGMALKRDKRAVITDPAPVPVHPAQGADRPALQAVVRAVRSRRHGDSPPRRQTRPARQARTGPASVGGPHGQEAAQDPHRLPPLPRLHPRQSGRERGTVTGEPSALKGADWVRREAARKRPAPTRARDLAAQPTLSPSRAVSGWPWMPLSSWRCLP